MGVCVCLYTQSCPTLWDSRGCVARPAPLPIKFSRQEYWSRLPFPIQGDIPDLGIEPPSLVSPALAEFFTTAHLASPYVACSKTGPGKWNVFLFSGWSELFWLFWVLCVNLRLSFSASTKTSARIWRGME